MSRRAIQAATLARSAKCRGNPGWFGAAHSLAQVCRWQGREVFAFTRPDDEAAQDFARRLGSAWVGGPDVMLPETLDVAILLAPVGALVKALQAVRTGNCIVCGGTHMSDIPSFPYRLLWEERQIVSVANLTRRGATEFLQAAPQAHVRTQTASTAAAARGRRPGPVGHGPTRQRG